MQKIEFELAQNIAVRLGVATAHCAIGTTMINGRVESITDKAVSIRLDNNDVVWFPKSALVSRRIDNTMTNCGNVMFCQTAKWFKATGANLYKINRASHSGFIAV